MKRLIDLDELLQYPLRRGSEHYDEKMLTLISYSVWNPFWSMHRHCPP